MEVLVYPIASKLSRKMATCCARWETVARDGEP
ncbi:hypothetical protein OKW20_001057 [Ensifer sp. LBL]